MDLHTDQDRDENEEHHRGKGIEPQLRELIILRSFFTGCPYRFIILLMSRARQGSGYSS